MELDALGRGQTGGYGAETSPPFGDSRAGDAVPMPAHAEPPLQGAGRKEQGQKVTEADSVQEGSSPALPAAITRPGGRRGGEGAVYALQLGLHKEATCWVLCWKRCSELV